MVEILVVTSIISLLSSTIYTSSSQAKAKAKLAAAQVAQKSKHSLVAQNTEASLTFNTIDTSTGQTLYKDKTSGMTFVPSGSVSQSSDVPMSNDSYLNTITSSNIGTNDISTSGSENTNSSLSLNTTSSLIAGTPGQGLIGKTLKTHSINLWVKFTDKDSGTPIQILDTSGNSIGMIRMNVIHCSSGGRFMICQTAEDNAFGPTYDGFTVNNTTTPYFLYKPPLNEWINVSYSYSYENDNLTVYINGQKLYDKPGYNIPAGLNWVVSAVKIGGTDFTGLVDSVAIYNTVLTADNIKSIYAKGHTSSGVAVK